MIKRILVYGLLSSLIQIVFYLILLYSVQLIQYLTITSRHEEFIDNYGILLSVIIFAPIIIIQNVLSTLIDYKVFKWIAFTIVLFIYLIGWGEDFNSWPYRTFIFLISGTSTLLSKFYIDQKLKI